MEHRGVTVEKKMVLFVNTRWGDSNKCSGIYEFNIEITTTTRDDDEDEEMEAEDSSSSVVVVVVVNSKYIEGTVDPLKPIHLFCDQKKDVRGIGQVCSVGSCLLDDSKLYMFPDDKGDSSYYYSQKTEEFDNKSHTLKPCSIFNFKTGKEEDLPALPQARKVEPIVAVLRNQLFVLSSHSYNLIATPVFESLPLLDDDKQQQEWKGLNFPALNSVYSFASVTGYAVLEEEDFILVSLSWKGLGPFEFFSYNVQSGLWKPIRDPPPALLDGADDFFHQFFDKKALVVGNDIYSFNHYDLYLVVFSYTVLHHHPYNNSSGAEQQEEEHDISLNGLSTRVRGLDHYGMKFPLISEIEYSRTTAIAKVDEDLGLYCLLHTLLPFSFPFSTYKEEVYFTFVQFKSRDSCQIIKTLTCALSVGDDLSLLLLESCYVIPVDVDEKEDQHCSKRAANDTDDDAQEQLSREAGRITS